MDLTLIGYFLKRRLTRTDWVSPFQDDRESPFPVGPPVEQICNVSQCIAHGPHDVKELPFPNEFGGYETPAQAWESLEGDSGHLFELYAFRILPLLFDGGESFPLSVPPLNLEPLPGSFVRLGFDVVEVINGQCLGCSPLSCNGRYLDAKINPFCLVSSQGEAVSLAKDFSISKPEPGPYGVVEVWRQDDSEF